MAYTVHSPAKIVYGNGAFQTLGDHAQKLGTTALIISDPIMEDLGVVAQCAAHLKQASVAYTGVTSEPLDVYVNEGLALLREHQCDVIVSIGGGSCIDTAKAISVVATNRGYIGDYMHGATPITELPIPHIAIPTTAGTGSEATDVTVITNTAEDIKMMIKDAAFMPDVALVDAQLTVSSPRHITAATGVDAMSHAIESLLSRKAHPFSNQLALSAIELITANLLPAYRDGHNLAAREAMSLGSLQAGMAFSNASVALVHGMSRPIGALFHVPHGISNAMLLPAVLEFSKENCTPQLAKMAPFFIEQTADLSEEELAEEVIQAVKALCRSLDIPNLKGYGIEESAFYAAIPKMVVDAIASGSPANNPRIPTEEELAQLYKDVYHYVF
ncbi:alcohol dehydrogenase [Kurthia sp. 3B1D]|uniref:Alcohol dehydrogenase n=1 Tax=Candidatus Kurthia intestinigallinarum TaxID=1562256 RepID=A0A433RQU8_9BACL|nr:iron-containing alcohol dehydrogenase [Kurthia sp. 3B1D]RUS53086.1 alcohol dehydrogenase [Kurthia sp. 3B1D]